MIIPTCTPYFRELLARSKENQKPTLFQAACRILSPRLQQLDAAGFCKELGVGEEYIPLYKQVVHRRQ